MSTYDTLEVATAEGVTTVRLDRPEALNALSFRMVEELLELLPRLEQDPGTKAVLLTGNGRGFCSGADVGEMVARGLNEGASGPARAREIMREGSARLAIAFLEFAKPLVAAVNGPCAGAGVGIALSADVLVAAESAVFSVAFVRRGLVPDYGVTFLLPRLVGLRKARELCLFGDRLSARDAAGLGLVTDVVADADLEPRAREMAARLAAGPGIALALTKRMLADTFETGASAAVEREFTYQSLCLVSEDAKEGMMAFLEKRPPDFQGR